MYEIIDFKINEGIEYNNELHIVKGMRHRNINGKSFNELYLLSYYSNQLNIYDAFWIDVNDKGISKVLQFPKVITPIAQLIDMLNKGNKVHEKYEEYEHILSMVKKVANELQGIDLINGKEKKTFLNWLKTNRN